MMNLDWSEREDLNLRPPVPQTGALTRLRYAPNQDSCYCADVLASEPIFLQSWLLNRVVTQL